MIVKKPNFWDKKGLNIISFLLLPLTIPIILNNFFLKIFEKNKSKEIFSICIGNIYVGGTGKTPLTIKLFQLLKKNQRKIITAKKFHKNHEDEIMLLRRKTQFLTNSSRLKIINEAIKKKI